MSKIIRFTKMHGLGNDYIYVNSSLYPIKNPSAASVKWSNRHKGIGADGLVLIGKSTVADFSMRIFNADGSEAMMCGNASRCIGKFVYENAPYLWIKTPDGISSWNFFDQMLHEANVVVTPGIGFGPSGEGYVRLTAFGHREDCEEAMKRIKQWMN